MKKNKPIQHLSFGSTPDLSKEFHPFPKTFKAKKEPAKLGPGKKTIASLDAVAQFKKQFAAWGIVKCEYTHKGCWINNALTFAHIDKRGHLTPEDVKDPKCVALICTPGHIEIEQLPRAEMRKIIADIVKNRESLLEY